MTDILAILFSGIIIFAVVCIWYLVSPPAVRCPNDKCMAKHEKPGLERDAYCEKCGYYKL